MAKFHFDGDADVAKALQKLLSVAAAEKKIEDGAKKAAAAGKDAGDKMKQGADKGKSALGEATKSVLAMAAGVASISGAWMLARKELTDYMERQRAAAQTSTTWAQARAKALEMRPGDSPVAVGKMITAAADAAGLTESQMWLASTKAFSAAKGFALEQVGNALGDAGKIERAQGGGAQEIADRSSYTLDVMRQTGATAAEAAGMLSSVVAASRGTSMPLIAKAFVPAAAGFAGYGDTEKETYGFLAGMSHLMTDVTGEKTGTGFSVMRENLAAILVGDRPLAATNSLGRLKELIPVFQAMSPEDQKALLVKIGGGAVYQGKVRMLLEGQEGAWAEIAAGIAGIATGPTAAEMPAQYLKDVYGVPEMAPDAFKSPFKRAWEDIDRDRVPETMPVVGWDTFKESLDKVGVSWWDGARFRAYANYGLEAVTGGDVHEQSETGFRAALQEANRRIHIAARRGDPGTRDKALRDGLLRLLEALEEAKAGVGQALGGVEAEAVPDNPNAQVE